MRPKEPDHVWVIEEKQYDTWYALDMYDNRRDARVGSLDYRGYLRSCPRRIRKYIPVNRLSMEMVVR